MNTNDVSSQISISKVGPDITGLAFNQRGGIMAYSDAKGEVKVDQK